MIRVTLLVSLLSAACGVVALGACGKMGPPIPAGPPNQLTYPKSYPTN